MRIIARLDVKNSNLIKSRNLEGLRVVGDPNIFASKYYSEGADEIIFMDLVASLYNRNSLYEIIKIASQNIFIPFTVGGGIRSIDDALKIFDSGADKIAINTAAVKDPNLISILSKRFGSQAIVLSIEAKKIAENKWENYIECGRQDTGIDVVEWAKKNADLGAGEILLTSIDREGTSKGFDYDLIKSVTDSVNIPILASGGFGSLNDIEKISNLDIKGIVIADAIHFNKINLSSIRKKAKNVGFKVRNF